MPYDKERNLDPEKETDDKKKSDSQGKTAAEDAVPEKNGAPGEETQEPKYSFLKETIKPKPISREKLLKEFVRIAIYGVILGAFACVGFFALKPWAQDWFRGTPDTVSIPEDEEPDAEEEEETEPVQQTDPVLDAQSGEEIMTSMYDLAEEGQKGIVSVDRAVAADQPGAETGGSSQSVTGVITADNGQELLILADNSICSDAQSWTVTFADGSSYTASLKKQDRNTGLAVFSVPRSDISSATWSAVKVAVLGNSNLMKQGDMVMALGNMFGYADGVGYGRQQVVEHGNREQQQGDYAEQYHRVAHFGVGGVHPVEGGQPVAYRGAFLLQFFERLVLLLHQAYRVIEAVGVHAFGESHIAGIPVVAEPVLGRDAGHRAHRNQHVDVEAAVLGEILEHSAHGHGNLGHVVVVEDFAHGLLDSAEFRGEGFGDHRVEGYGEDFGRIADEYAPLEDVEEGGVGEQNVAAGADGVAFAVGEIRTVHDERGAGGLLDSGHVLLESGGDSAADVEIFAHRALEH